MGGIREKNVSPIRASLLLLLFSLLLYFSFNFLLY